DYPGVFHGLQFYVGQDETGKVRAYLGKDDRVSNAYTNIFSDDYLTLSPVGIWDDREIEEKDTAFDYRYTNNASYFPGFTPQIDMFYETPVDGSPADDSFDRERNTYFQVNFLDELKVWNGEDFVATGGEVMTWSQENWDVNDKGEWYAEFANEVTTGEGVVKGKPYYYAVYDEPGNDHWHYVMELQEGTSPTGIDDGLYLLPIEVETNIPDSIPSDPVYILYNQNLSAAPDVDQDTILAAQNYLLEEYGMTEPAQEFKAFLDSSQNGVDSDATGLATFSLNAEQTEIEYTIELNGLDLIEDPVKRTAENAITEIHFHHRGYGTDGSHVLNVFGTPSEDDDNIEIDYENERIIGKWDWSDAAANFARHSEPKSDGVYGDWKAPKLEIEVVDAYNNGALGIKLRDEEPEDKLNIFEGTQLNFDNGARVKITENITISKAKSSIVEASILEGGDIPAGEIAILSPAQMPGTTPVTTSLFNLFHGNLYVQVHTNQNPE
ncbi:CHRD domain-containing protein, partial [Trichodesmium erythraeum 21-75]|nr:CHRD domain-containing protein [Trichodesmium erythraeum 21-75]